MYNPDYVSDVGEGCEPCDVPSACVFTVRWTQTFSPIWAPILCTDGVWVGEGMVRGMPMSSITQDKNTIKHKLVFMVTHAD